MPGVQKVEASVGEDDFVAALTVVGDARHEVVQR
jgi:hypothetical protein